MRCTGLVHGIEKRSGVSGKDEWNIAVSDEDSFEHDSCAFVHDCRKLFFAHIQVEGDSALDRDARRCAAQMTPARQRALQPRSVVQVIDALSGACASAPAYAALADSARAAVQEALLSDHDGAAEASSVAASDVPSSPPERRPRKGRRRGDVANHPSIHSPLAEASYSPALPMPQPGACRSLPWRPVVQRACARRDALGLCGALYPPT